MPPVQVAAFLAALRARGETPAEIGERRGCSCGKPGPSPSGPGSWWTTAAPGETARGPSTSPPRRPSWPPEEESPWQSTATGPSPAGAAAPTWPRPWERPFPPPERAAACLDSAGLVLLFAPHFHPVMGNVAEIRKSLGVRTLFNILGPLVNPAPLTHQVMGVFDAALLSPAAEVLRSLGRQGMVIAGHGGFDELSLAGPNRVVFFSAEGLREESVSPADGGLPLRGNETSPEGPPRKRRPHRGRAGRKAGRSQGRRGLNAAAVFLAAGRAKNWKEEPPSRRRASTPAGRHPCWRRSGPSRNRSARSA